MTWVTTPRDFANLNFASHLGRQKTNWEVGTTDVNNGTYHASQYERSISVPHTELEA